MHYSRSVSDGWVLPEGGAEGGELLGHRLQRRALPRGHVRVVHAPEGRRTVQRVNLRAIHVLGYKSMIGGKFVLLYAHFLVILEL